MSQSKPAGAVMETYKRLDIAPTSGRGSWLYDDRGSGYLDFIAGLATNSLGHSHPALVGAIKEQAEKLIHCSNLYEAPLQREVAQILTENTDFDRVFFCNSGTEANEAAIKLARKHAGERYGHHKHEVIAFSGGFHGRTYGSLSATANHTYHEGFGPMSPGFVHAPFGDLDAVEKKIGPRTAAILVEPVQGEGGVNTAPENFLEGLRELCTEHGALLVFDEVQTGAGRTGSLYAYQAIGVVPDVLTSAKGLGGGVPVGAVLVKEEYASLTPGSHGSTFGGNPLAMAAVKTVLNVVGEEDFLAEVRLKGNILTKALERLVRHVAPRYQAAEVRGDGLLLGLDLGPEIAPKVFEKCLAEGLLVNLIGGAVIRLAPPLTVTRTEVRIALDILRRAVAETLEEILEAPAEPAEAAVA